MATIPELYNFNEARTCDYKQSFVLTEEDHCQKYLDHIPKDQSLVIKDVTLGTYFTIVNNKDAIQPGEVYYDYRSAFDYVSAKGLLIFNADDAASGDEIEVSYIPVASRVDADVINKLILHHNTYDGNIYTKTDLLTPTAEDIIAWTTIKDRPGYATETTGGLITADDAKILRSIPSPYIPPVGGIILDDISITSTAWGNKLNISLGDGLTALKTGDESATLSLDKNGILAITGITAGQLQALPGAVDVGKSTAGPGDTNRYVLDQDIRLSDYRNPLAHTHSVEDVSNLQSLLDNKADSIHYHSTDDITGIEKLKGEDGKSCQLTVDSTVTLAAGSQAKVTNLGTQYDVKLKFEIPQGVDGKMVLNWEDWESLTEEQKSQIRIQGPKGDTGMGAAVSIDKVTTGEEGSEAQCIAKDPIEKYWPTLEKYLLTTGLEMTIPRGDRGVQGYPGAVTLGTVTTGEASSEAQVVVHDPELTKIGENYYYASTLDFQLPRGPKGTAVVNALTFSEDSEKWSENSEDQTYTYTTSIAGGIPVSLAYKEVSSGLYEVTFAKVRFNANTLYIIADQKFTGRIYIDGGIE